MTRDEFIRKLDETVNKRRGVYAPPERNFERIAKLVRAWLESRYGVEMLVDEIDEADVAMIGVMVKIGRLAENIEHDDSWLDVAGYAMCGSEVASVMKDDNLVYKGSSAQDALDAIDEHLRKFNAGWSTQTQKAEDDGFETVEPGYGEIKECPHRRAVRDRLLLTYGISESDLDIDVEYSKRVWDGRPAGVIDVADGVRQNMLNLTAGGYAAKRHAW